MGKREKALAPKVYICSCVKVLGVLWVRLLMNLVSSIRGFAIFMILGSEKGFA